MRPEPGLLTLRKTLGLYANIRPANFASESLLLYSPLKPFIAQGVNMIVIRELIGGAYFELPRDAGGAFTRGSVLFAALLTSSLDTFGEVRVVPRPHQLAPLTRPRRSSSRCPAVRS